MKKNILRLAAMLLVVAGVVSCQTKSEDDQLAALEGTKWKLASIVDDTGALKVLEPINCKECYTITFDTDSTFRSNSASNEIWGSCKIDYETGDIFIHCDLMTEVAAIGDENLYIEILNTVQSLFLQNNELRLYYNGKRNYLLFKSQ